jgi:3(or 17)beta-hydroxysteroid dehydrogenase
MKRFEKKVAVVTGGASGLGKAIAQRFAAEGARVTISDIQVDLGEVTAAEGGFRFAQHDVSDETQWARTIQEVEQREGRLDILVNNAGILGRRDLVNPEDTPFADWKKILTINVDSVFLGCKTAIPAMRRAGGGSIINMSSVAGLTATPYATAYGASKATVRQLTKSVAQYCAEHRLNIRCNSVHPGNVVTPLWMRHAEESAQLRGISVEAFMTLARNNVPLGELSCPEDIAAAVAFLASDDARHITGEKLIVDGGFVSCDTYRPGSGQPPQ